MPDIIEGAPGHMPVGFDRGRQRYVTAFGIGYFFLCQVGGPLMHFAFSPGTAYWHDPLPLLAHALGIVVAGLLVLAPQRATMASYVVIWSTWLTVWAAVWATAGTVNGERVPFYLATAPLLAGLLMSTRHVVVVGGLNVFGIAVMAAIGRVPGATAMNAALLTIVATMVLGIGAYTRRLDEAIIGGQARQLVSRTAELQAIMDAASEGMVAFDGAGRIVNANPAAIELTGGSRLSRGEPMDASLPRQIAHVVETLQESGRQGPDDVELGGRVLRVGLRALPGPRDGHLVTIQDVTEERAAEEQRHLAELRRSEIEKLREVTRFKSNLLNAASHELNTPLTPVRLQMELLRSPDRGPLTPKQTHSLDILDRNIQRLSSLITDILDVAKLDGARLPLRVVPVAMESLVRNEVAGFADNAQRSGITLDTDIQGSAWVRGDPARLGQVIANLVSNAIKFTPRGGVKVSFTVDGGWATVSVQDTGVGVPHGTEDQLFEPFSQLHESAREAEGAGMGLYLSRGIIEAHGGIMEFERLRDGSRFWFRIPTDTIAVSVAEPIAAR